MSIACIIVLFDMAVYLTQHNHITVKFWGDTSTVNGTVFAKHNSAICGGGWGQAYFWYTAHDRGGSTHLRPRIIRIVPSLYRYGAS